MKEEERKKILEECSYWASIFGWFIIAICALIMTIDFTHFYLNEHIEDNNENAEPSASERVAYRRLSTTNDIYTYGIENSMLEFNNTQDLLADYFGLEDYIDEDNQLYFYAFPSNAFFVSNNGENRLPIYAYEFKYLQEHSFDKFSVYLTESDYNNKTNAILLYNIDYTNYIPHSYKVFNYQNITYCRDKWFDDRNWVPYIQGYVSLFNALNYNYGLYNGVLFSSFLDSLMYTNVLSVNSYGKGYFKVENFSEQYIVITLPIRFVYQYETYETMQLIYYNASTMRTTALYDTTNWTESTGGIIYEQGLNAYCLMNIKGTSINSGSQVVLGQIDETYIWYYPSGSDVKQVLNVLTLGRFGLLNNNGNKFDLQILSGLSTIVQSNAGSNISAYGLTSREFLANYGDYMTYFIEDNSSSSSSGAITNVFQLIATAFSSMTSLFNIQLVPGLTIGLLLFAPLVGTIIIVIIRLVKK